MAMRHWMGALFLMLTLLVPAAAQAPGRGGWRLPERPVVEAGPEPLAWGLPAAAHLMRRAGFSGSLEAVDGVANGGFEAALDLLIDYEKVDDSAMEAALAAKAYPLVRTNQNGQQVADGGALQRWWMFRILNSRRQLLEKMTLFWHDHFATSLGVVRFVDGSDRPLMLVQNQTLRQHALGNFKSLVEAIARDPAMIVWLNNFENVKGSPNENWARELMELFTMGEGNGYTETDIQEAARAFTGWSLVRPRRDQAPRGQALTFQFYPETHDEGVKTVLGQSFQAPPGSSGIEDGQRVIDIIFEQPQVAEFISRKLWEYFVYLDPDDEVIQPLAQTFRDSGYELKALMRAIFEHPHFLSEKAYRAKIKSPVELVCGAYRELGVSDPDNLPRVVEFFGLGQSLFYPPDVGGWTSDAGWINTGTILGRYNFFTFVSSNRGDGMRDNGQQRRNPVRDQVDVEGLIEAYQLASSSDVIDFFSLAMVQGDLSIDSRSTLELYLTTDDGGGPLEFDIQNPALVDKKVRGLIFLVGLLPVYQLN